MSIAIRKIMARVERAVTITALINQAIKALNLKRYWANDKQDNTAEWKLHSATTGDLAGRMKSACFTLELVLDVSEMEARRLLKGTPHGDHPRTHAFLLQATYDMRADSGDVSIWLRQGGQIVSFGAPSVEFKSNDFNSYMAAIKKAMEIDTKTLLTKLYSSRYADYGR